MKTTKRTSSDAPKGKAKNLLTHGQDISMGRSSADRLTPFHFDEFVPWLCALYEIPVNVEVTRIYQEDYVTKAHDRRVSSKSAKNAKVKVNDSPTGAQQKDSTISQKRNEDCIPMKTFYNIQGQLQEISIVGSPFNIERVIIQVLILVVPYHPTLYKLTINKGLSAGLLHDIGKLLIYSYLTDICLDDSFVPQKNYTDLLRETSHLRSLSLNRCRLLDETCKEIAACIDVGTPGSSLRTLELSSNKITDEGALAFANVLRRNRQLLHLNLSGNLITDKGAISILNVLMEFSMTLDEIRDMKRHKMECHRKKMALYDQYVKEMTIAKQRAEARAKSGSRSRSMRTTTAGSKSKSPASKKSSSKKSHVGDSLSASREGTEKSLKVEYSHPELEQKARAVAGEIFEPFDEDHRIFRDKYFYCVGNMFLCSLNLAYNNLDFTCIQKIRSVLEYQSRVRKPAGATGLLRVTIDGNLVPIYCDGYLEIDLLLQAAVNQIVPKSSAVLKKKDGLLRKSAGTISSKS